MLYVCRWFYGSKIFTVYERSEIMHTQQQLLLMVTPFLAWRLPINGFCESNLHHQVMHVRGLQFIALQCNILSSKNKSNFVCLIADFSIEDLLSNSFKLSERLW